MRMMWMFDGMDSKIHSFKKTRSCPVSMRSMQEAQQLGSVIFAFKTEDKIFELRLTKEEAKDLIIQIEQQLNFSDDEYQ
jgi:hypothetical protein